MEALEDMLSEDHMKKLMNRFISHYKYSVYSSKSFEEEVIQYYNQINNNAANMKSFITSWTHLPGLPFVEVIPGYSRDLRLQTITILQVTAFVVTYY